MTSIHLGVPYREGDPLQIYEDLLTKTGKLASHMTLQLLSSSPCQQIGDIELCAVKIFK